MNLINLSNKLKNSVQRLVLLKFFYKKNIFIDFLKIFENILALKTPIRIFILILMDISILVISLLITSILLSVDNLFYFKASNYRLLLSLIIFAIPFYYFTGHYKDLTRFIGSKSIYKILIRNCFIIFIIHNIISPPLSVSFVLWTFASSISYTSRIFLRDIILQVNKKRQKLSPVLIYGAGSAGARLLENIKLLNTYSVKGFVDDNPSLWGRSILGIRIYSPKDLLSLRESLKIKKVLIAIPSISKSNLKSISDNLNSLNIPVLQIPSLSDILTGKAKIDKLRPIQIEDILGRDEVYSHYELVSKDIVNSTILVTGAGGSIGSELCRVLIDLKPQKLILFDNSEPSLYSIYHELSDNHLGECKVVPLLGSATNSKLVDNVIKKNKVSVIFHAAAYKHVPLVEMNPLQGLENNINSTRVLCESAFKNKIDKFVLISSDKAVRPTNLMGVSKRISELIVQAYHEEIPELKLNLNKTIFLMVRFGNVINSSGSVIPLFRNQINKGGPITLTHPKITRYFMTINESCQLVLQASSLAKGGDVFLLDMGEPVEIKKVAEQMISLSGLTLKNIDNPNGDIEIIITGLRSGEKLYEELLIGNDSLSTEHPLIFKEKENFIDKKILNQKLELLDKYIKQLNLEKTINVISDLVPEWESEIYKKPFK